MTIQYIDYGDKETKPPSEVYPLYPEFAKLPQVGGSMASALTSTMFCFLGLHRGACSRESAAAEPEMSIFCD